MNKLKKIWAFIKRNWKWILGGLAVVIAMIFGVKYIRNTRKNQIQQHKINVLKAENEVAKLEGKREVIRNLENSKEDEITAIDEDIKKLDDKIKSSRIEINKLTAEEKLERFKRLGY